MKPVRVLVVDDDPTIRDGLLAILETQPDMLTVGESACGLEALSAACSLYPDVILMGMNTPHLDGFETTRLIKQACPDTKVIVLTVYGTHVSEAFAAGASRYLLKDSSPADLVQAITGLAVS